ncbi:MAG: hypothetical protein EHM16_10220 [Betaproteobacteria bacterium]|nr:MAG: hypothetical protein EHM16_10220 [Betaproteobacteria bacterium]
MYLLNILLLFALAWPLLFLAWLAFGLLIAYNLTRLPAARKSPVPAGILALVICAHTPSLPVWIQIKRHEFNIRLDAECAPYKANRSRVARLTWYEPRASSTGRTTIPSSTSGFSAMPAALPIDSADQLTLTQGVMTGTPS